MTAYPYILRNVAQRPIELHRTTGVVRVLSPGEMIVVNAPDASCDLLEKAGALTRHAVPPPAPRMPKAKPKAKPRAKPNPKPRAKGARAGPKAGTASKSTTPRKTKSKTNARPAAADRSPADHPGGSK